MRKSTLLASALFAALITTGTLAAHAQSGMDKVKSMTKEAANKVNSYAEKAGDYLDDSSITTEIKSKFLAEKNLDSLDISVKTVDGVVILTGVVDNAAQSRIAEMISQSTKSVKMVDNKITVKK